MFRKQQLAQWNHQFPSCPSAVLSLSLSLSLPEPEILSFTSQQTFKIGDTQKKIIAVDKTVQKLETADGF
jgi:hypothetical protein